MEATGSLLFHHPLPGAVRDAGRTRPAGGAEAAVFGLREPRVAVAAAALRGNARLGVVGQRLRSCSPERELAEPSPWKRVHFRRAVTSVSFMLSSLPASFLPFTFFFRGFSSGKWRDASPESFSVGFCILWFDLVCSVSQEPSGTWLWNFLSWISPPRGGLWTAVCVADLGAAPAGPPRPWQAGCTISVLICRKTHFYPLASQREKNSYRGR